MAVCEILSVGTEILLGDILNTNSRYLSQELAKLGISVLRHTTVGDNADRLAAALSTALERSDIVIATGGLASSILPYCREKFILDETLLIDGLYTIYRKNV